MCLHIKRFFFLIFLKFKILSLSTVLALFLYLHFITIWTDNSELCISQSGICDDYSTIYNVDYVNNIPLCSPQECLPQSNYKKCLLSLNSVTVLNNLNQIPVGELHLVIPFVWAVIGMSASAIFFYVIISCLRISNTLGFWTNIIWIAKLTDAVSPLSIILSFYLTTYSKSAKYIYKVGCPSNLVDSTFCKSLSGCSSDIRRVFTTDSPIIFNFVIIANVLAAFVIGGIVSSIYVFIQALPDDQLQHSMRRATSRAIKLFSKWNFNPPPNLSNETMECPICLRPMLFMPLVVEKNNEKKSNYTNNSVRRRGGGGTSLIESENRNKPESAFSFRSTASGPINLRSTRIAATVSVRNSIADVEVTDALNYRNVIRMSRDSSIASMIVIPPSHGDGRSRSRSQGRSSVDMINNLHSFRNTPRRAVSVNQNHPFISQSQEPHAITPIIKRFNSTEGVPHRIVTNQRHTNITASLLTNGGNNLQRQQIQQVQASLQSPVPEEEYKQQHQHRLLPVEEPRQLLSLTATATADVTQETPHDACLVYDENIDVINGIRNFSSSSIVNRGGCSKLAIAAETKDKDNDTDREGGRDTARMACGGGAGKDFKLVHSSDSLGSSTSTTSFDHVTVLSSSTSFPAPAPVLDSLRHRSKSQSLSDEIQREVKPLGRSRLVSSAMSPSSTEQPIIVIQNRDLNHVQTPVPVQQTSSYQHVESRQDVTPPYLQHVQPEHLLPMSSSEDSSLSVAIATKTPQERNKIINKQESIYPSDYILAQVPCGHIFHKACIIEWGLRENTCPACRADLAAGNDVNGVDSDAENRFSEGRTIRNNWVVGQGMI